MNARLSAFSSADRVKSPPPLLNLLFWVPAQDVTWLSTCAQG